MPAFSLRPLARTEFSTLPGLPREDKFDRMPRLWPFAMRVQPLPQADSPEISVKASAPATHASQPLLRRRAEPASESAREELNSSLSTHRTFSDGGLSSGSEHEPNSLCLAAMVNEFIEEDEKRFEQQGQCTCEYGTCDGFSCLASDDEGNDLRHSGELLKIMQALTKCASSSERRLLAEVTGIVNAVREDEQGGSLCSPALEDCSGGCMRRCVMALLRELGYNAAICKSRWDHSRGFPGGDYEYIDVVSDLPFGKDRLLIDLDLRGQFQIARPTPLYAACLEVVPTVFVGRLDRLQQLVDVMTDATKRSLKRNSMPLPPWRKLEYMRAKWVAPYRRTTNEIPLSGHAAGCVAHVVRKGVNSKISTDGRQREGMAPMSQFAARGKETEQAALVSRPPDSVASLSADASISALSASDLGLPSVDAVIFAGRVVPVGDLEERVRGGMAALRLAGIPAMSDCASLSKVAEVAEQAEESAEGGKDSNGSDTVFETKRAAAPKGVAHSEWQLPSVEPRQGRAGKVRVRAGLAAILKDGGSAKQPSASQLATIEK